MSKTATFDAQSDPNTKDQIKHAYTNHQTQHRCTWFYRFDSKACGKVTGEH
jgi:hypothetical protein